MRLHTMQPLSTGAVEFFGNDGPGCAGIALHMAATPRIHKDKTSRRKHYVPEWAEVRQLTQADIVKATGADKGTVSRWFSGNTPQDHYLDALAGCLSLDDREALFRHPDDDWMARFLRGRSAEERERIKTLLEMAFPKKVA
jgi:hypothetical protein